VYLRGLFYHDKGWGKEDADAAIGMFERAIALDPELAPAYAQLARSYVYSYQLEARPEVAAKASAAAEKSLSLDPSLAEAYVARGEIALMIALSPPEIAIADFRHALALNPNLPEGHWQLGAEYLHIGLLDQALIELNAALALDPDNLRPRFYIPRLHLYQQRYDEAFHYYEQSPDVAPAQQWEKALTLFYRSEKTDAHSLIDELRRKVPNNQDIASTYAILLAAEGKSEEAEEQIRFAIRKGEVLRWHFHHTEYNIASAYALMGNHREALHWLRMTAEDGLTPYPLFAGDPNLNNLRSDPDFKTWLAEMKSLWERRREEQRRAGL
jgi:tetratricopeptide (TPR) repeat protein